MKDVIVNNLFLYNCISMLLSIYKMCLRNDKTMNKKFALKFYYYCLDFFLFLMEFYKIWTINGEI